MPAKKGTAALREAERKAAAEKAAQDRKLRTPRDEAEFTARPTFGEIMGIDLSPLALGLCRGLFLDLLCALVWAQCRMWADLGPALANAGVGMAAKFLPTFLVPFAPWVAIGAPLAFMGLVVGFALYTGTLSDNNGISLEDKFKAGAAVTDWVLPVAVFVLGTTMGFGLTSALWATCLTSIGSSILWGIVPQFLQPQAPGEAPPPPAPAAGSGHTLPASKSKAKPSAELKGKKQIDSDLANDEISARSTFLPSGGPTRNRARIEREAEVRTTPQNRLKLN